jgi:hypothetical protein
MLPMAAGLLSCPWASVRAATVPLVDFCDVKMAFALDAGKKAVPRSGKEAEEVDGLIRAIPHVTTR